MKHIGNLTYAPGSRKKKKRIGRGAGSGHGGTSTRGHKGHQSRSNHTFKRHFEGGQMPLTRRIPKFGFTNIFRVEYQVVNISRLQELVDNNIITNDVTPEILFANNVVSKRNTPIKILGNGNLSAKLNVMAHGFSESAKQKIEQAGGTVNTHE
ncbi:MAG: 50S ribosomal protein L15 [Candidatus Kapabacteria bacterium]|nr:50S ribosomal protein L15 [Candidatus Kapabacteria bacterium]MBX7153787.1 50S ribosomal protein L15 [Bacteroidota bacterium]